MNEADTRTIDESLKQLFGLTGPAYKDACQAERRAQDAVRVAEEEMQDQFRPHWKKIMAIVRRECAKRGVRVVANREGVDRVARVETYKGEPRAVGVGHIAYTVSPYIHVELWIGHGMSIEWGGYAQTAAEFQRKFAVLLATVDGYMAGCLANGGRDCATCGMPKIVDQYDGGKCQRCVECSGGSMWM